VADEVVIGLGGNLGGEPAILERFRRAREALVELGPVRSAPLYRTAALGPAQPDFLNTALAVRIPDARPGELIATVLELEQLLGRDRLGEPRDGPRAIDLDVLLWGERVIAEPGLSVPHPRLAVRRFALEPVIALCGEDVAIPNAGRAGSLHAAVRDQVVELIAERW
jgi:2-amino-4-hydroxy-6-hydroxymethyldihydropteridine diphosphokinase